MAPDLVCRWYHGQTEISPSLHPEYQLVGRRLVIKSFSDRLKGRYTCKAVNGFGSASYSFLLSVGGEMVVEDGERVPVWRVVSSVSV